MTYQSKNSLSDFEFHDSFVKLHESCNQELRLCANGLNLHKNAKQNEEGLHDLELGNAVIRFENATLQNIASVTSKDHCDHEAQIADLTESLLQKLIHGGEIIYLKTPQPGHAIISIDFCENGLYTMELLYVNVFVEWEQFIGYSWYEKG